MLCRWIPVWLVAVGIAVWSSAAEPPKSSPAREDLSRLIRSSCLECHDGTNKTAGLDLAGLLDTEESDHAESWEKVVRKLAARQMPPRGSLRPSEREYVAALTWLESSLDAAAARHPRPGRTETFRRLNRTEYGNTIRDLLGIEIDAGSLLPPDESSNGFDNITVADLSPALLSRYLSAAEKISRLAVGSGPPEVDGHTVRVRPDVTQDSHVDGLPLGTRGGVLVPYHFPRDGEYEVQVRLMRDRNEEIESLREPHDLEVMLDRQRVELFRVKPPRGKDESHQTVDASLNCRVAVTAGPHKVGVAFLQKGASLLETTRQPLNVHFNFYRHPRLGPAVYEVTILGPFGSSAPGDSPSRQRLFGDIALPVKPDNQTAAARTILERLVRRAYRRPITETDLKAPLRFFEQGRVGRGFEAGIELALSSVLVNPQFLFRIERDPAGLAPGAAYRLDGPALASRLSYFLWSSMPDDELLGLAETGELARPDVLERQVRRMLVDGRSRSLVENFAGQWLYLRNLEAATPDMRLFPDFDDNLRQAMRRETEFAFEEVLQEDRSVLELIRTDSTFLNERLARHYGIPHVQGSRFRRVSLGEDDHRGGLLRHASILTVTSYATRTSPVIRGQWVLENLIGTPSPPPPPNVPALDDNTVSSRLPVRERLRQHRADAACASCHNLMDPVGFSLENFDAVGRWRETEGEGEGRIPVDASGALPGGGDFTGVSGLEHALLTRPELFIQTFAEKLTTFAVGRGIEHFDAPAIRQIVRGARGDGDRLSRLILGVVQSPPFQMRSVP